jgi:hypothetical protein
LPWTFIALVFAPSSNAGAVDEIISQPAIATAAARPSRVRFLAGNLHRLGPGRTTIGSDDACFSLVAADLIMSRAQLGPLEAIGSVSNRFRRMEPALTARLTRSAGPFLPCLVLGPTSLTDGEAASRDEIVSQASRMLSGKGAPLTLLNVVRRRSVRLAAVSAILPIDTRIVTRNQRQHPPFRASASSQSCRLLGLEETEF